jgi:phosphatidylglycerol---prolipoprotein diacylglyceryl transferase
LLAYHNISPVIFKLGPFQLRWYGLAYVLGILLSFKLAKPYLVNKLKCNNEQIANLMLYIVIGTLLGGRFGYVLIYDFKYFILNPQNIFAIWQGGMSYHGAALGCLVSMVYFGIRNNKNIWLLLDLLGIGSTIGIFLGRIANFINGELFGRISDAPWAMIFPGGGNLPRHPSQLYESFFEGLLLFVILYFLLKSDKLKNGQLFAIYLFFYGLFRFVIEFFREPDIQIGFVFNILTMGQILCLVMIMIGLLLFFLFSKERK